MLISHQHAAASFRSVSCLNLTVEMMLGGIAVQLATATDSAEARKPRVSFADEEGQPEMLPVESSPPSLRSISFGQYKSNDCEYQTLETWGKLGPG